MERPDVDLKVLSESAITEIQLSLQRQAAELCKIEPRDLQLGFTVDEDLESIIRVEHIQRLTENEKKEISHDAKVNFGDSSYEGDVLQDKRHGLGRMIYQNGRSYFGEWKNDLRHGKGVETYSNNNKYMGEFQNGKASGVGTYSWNNGEVYRGE